MDGLEEEKEEEEEEEEAHCALFIGRRHVRDSLPTATNVLSKFPNWYVCVCIRFMCLRVRV